MASKDEINRLWKHLVESVPGTTIYVTMDQFHLIDTANYWKSSYSYSPQVLKHAMPSSPGYDYRPVLRVYAWLFTGFAGLSVGWILETRYDVKPGGVRVEDLDLSIESDTPPAWVLELLHRRTPGPTPEPYDDI